MGRGAQRLVVIDTLTQQERESATQYDLLELASFSGGIITGINSPAYRPQEVAVEISTSFDLRPEVQGCLALLTLAIAPGFLAPLVVTLWTEMARPAHALAVASLTAS